jgi:hypothetical protein
MNLPEIQESRNLLTQIQRVLNLHALRWIRQRQQLLHLPIDALAHFSNQKEESNRPPRLLNLTARQSPAELDSRQRRARRRQKNRRIHAQKLHVEVRLHHLIVFVFEEVEEDVFGLVEVFEDSHRLRSSLEERRLVDLLDLSWIRKHQLGEKLEGEVDGDETNAACWKMKKN